jgi:hypothetical protein
MADIFLGSFKPSMIGIPILGDKRSFTVVISGGTLTHFSGVTQREMVENPPPEDCLMINFELL